MRGEKKKHEYVTQCHSRDLGAGLRLGRKVRGAGKVAAGGGVPGGHIREYTNGKIEFIY